MNGQKVLTRGDRMRWVTTIVVFVVLLLTACRPESERSALARPASQATGVEVESRRVWAGAYVDFYASDVSPDGRYVTQIDWDTGDLAVRDLATGALHRLTDKGPWEESGDYASNARFSRDGRRIAYTWYDASSADYELRVLEFSANENGETGVVRGSGARVAYPADAPQRVRAVLDWTSADEVLVELYRPDNSTALARLSLSTGTLRVLASFVWGRGVGRARVSPDGRFIAYDHRVASVPPNMDIRLLSVDGQRETTLVATPEEDRVLGWTTDGSLLYHRSGSSEGSVWRIPIADGRPSGPAVRVGEAGLVGTPLGVAGDVLYHGLAVDWPSYATARIDVAGGRVVELPARFEAPPGGRIRTLAWSPDGRHVLQEIDHPGVPQSWIQLRRDTGELVEEWRFDLFISRNIFRWVPDGSSVLVPGTDARERTGFVRLDLETGESEMVRRFIPGGEGGRVFDVSPDGRTLYFTRWETRDGEPVDARTSRGGRPADVVAHDLATGDERVIERVRDHGGLSVSPDGEWLALSLPPSSGRKEIRVIPVGGGAGRTVYRGDARMSRLPAVLGWSADSGHILFLDEPASEPESHITVYRVSCDGGEVERIDAIPAYNGSAVDLHPDGQTIAYRAGETRGEIWAMDGLTASVTENTMEDDE